MSVAAKIRLRPDQYHVAWICPLTIEHLAARVMLDREHDQPNFVAHVASFDENVYRYGDINGHNIVIASLAEGSTGNVNAASLVGPLKGSFPQLRMCLLVGIGGGIPNHSPTRDPLHDIHLGDVVVGWPDGGKSPVVYVDSGRFKSDEFELRGEEFRPGKRLVSALTNMWADYLMDDLDFGPQLARLKKHRKFEPPPAESDRLFEPSCVHPSAYDAYGDCSSCDIAKLVNRPSRDHSIGNGLVFHRGRIATANSVCQDATRRDKIRDLGRGDIRCIEMEAAGVGTNLECLVVRGISDYADSHKNDDWKGVAAGNAAAFAAKLLCTMPSGTTASGPATPHPPESHCLVPFGRNRDFKGRSRILDQLLDIIPPSAERDGCQRVVLEGLGGIGKTQIALEAAFRLRERHPDCSVFWVPAMDVANFENAYRKIGRMLGVQGVDEDNADVKRLVKAALDSEDAGSWHLIIDNADDTELLFGDARLCDHLPSSRQGSILITTRTHEVAADLTQTSNIIIMHKMDQDEAVQTLQAYLQDDKLRGTYHDMTSLLKFLCFLPLAIKQAAVYMAKKGMGTARYLSHCQDSDQQLVKLLSKGFEDQGRYDAAQNPIATTWLVSFKHIQQNRPLAAKFLRFMCFLAEKDIPRSLLPDENELDADEALGELKAYAFITEREGADSFDLHRLVRLAMRNWVEREGEWVEGVVTEVIQQLAVAFPGPEHENRDVWLRYLPHAQVALASRQACIDEEASAQLLSVVGGSNLALGKYVEAETMYRQELELRKKVLGDKDPRTLASMNNLANVLAELKKYDEAETIHRQTLELKKKVLGDEHPNTFNSMNNLAITLNNQEKYDEAEIIHRQTLELKKKVLGDEHPDTLNSMNNLAITLNNQEKYDEAETIHRQTLELKKKVLDDEHPDIFASMYNLANTLNYQKKYDEAETILRQTLKLTKKVLGDEHPNTLKSMNNFADVIFNQGKYDEAEAMYRQTLELRKKVLGDEHPHTITTAEGLALVLSTQDRHDKEEMVEQPEKAGYLPAAKEPPRHLGREEAGRLEEATHPLTKPSSSSDSFASPSSPVKQRRTGLLSKIFKSRHK